MFSHLDSTFLNHFSDIQSLQCILMNVNLFYILKYHTRYWGASCIIVPYCRVRFSIDIYHAEPCYTTWLISHVYFQASFNIVTILYWTNNYILNCLLRIVINLIFSCLCFFSDGFLYSRILFLTTIFTLPIEHFNNVNES